MNGKIGKSSSEIEWARVFFDKLLEAQTRCQTMLVSYKIRRSFETATTVSLNLDKMMMMLQLPLAGLQSLPLCSTIDSTYREGYREFNVRCGHDHYMRGHFTCDLRPSSLFDLNQTFIFVNANPFLTSFYPLTEISMDGHSCSHPLEQPQYQLPAPKEKEKEQKAEEKEKENEKNEKRSSEESEEKETKEKQEEHSITFNKEPPPEMAKGCSSGLLMVRKGVVYLNAQVTMIELATRDFSRDCPFVSDPLATQALFDGLPFRVRHPRLNAHYSCISRGGSNPSSQTAQKKAKGVSLLESLRGPSFVPLPPEPDL